MNNHPDDFCYWIHNSKYWNESLFEANNISKDSNLMAAMFTEQIADGVSEWTEWSDISNTRNSERFIKYKGQFFLMFKRFKNQFI